MHVVLSFLQGRSHHGTQQEQYHAHEVDPMLVLHIQHPCVIVFVTVLARHLKMIRVHLFSQVSEAAESNSIPIT